MPGESPTPAARVGSSEDNRSFTNRHKQQIIVCTAVAFVLTFLISLAALIVGSIALSNSNNAQQGISSTTTPFLTNGTTISGITNPETSEYTIGTATTPRLGLVVDDTGCEVSMDSNIGVFNTTFSYFERFIGKFLGNITGLSNSSRFLITPEAHSDTHTRPLLNFPISSLDCSQRNLTLAATHKECGSEILNNIMSTFYNKTPVATVPEQSNNFDMISSQNPANFVKFSFEDAVPNDELCARSVLGRILSGK